MAAHIRIETAAGLMSVTLARPEKKNALTGAMYQALCEALTQASADAAIRTVLLSGEGSDFCSGNDIGDFLAEGLSGPALENSAALRFLRGLAGFAKPLVAAVQGQAVGIGATMLLHCDLVYLAEDASLSMPFANLALTPEAASSLLLPARIGHARAFALFALGESLDAPTAVQWGLANAVLAREQLLPKTQAAALALIARPAQALMATKRLMREHIGLSAALDAEAAEFAARLVSSEAQAVFEAFLKRSRTPPTAR
jgi:enoyl-CoA hydratase/carnithine racemase